MKSVMPDMQPMNQTVQETPVFEVLSEDQIEQIYFAALEVLERVGSRVHHDEALELFRNSGDAAVGDDKRVRVTASLVNAH
jgi:trimethylamine---corrinoid protein Co-methyltransferase